MAGVLDQLGQSVVPQIFGALNGAGLMDLMNIVRPIEAQGAGGGMIKGADEVIYQNVPVQVKAKRRYLNNVAGDKPQSISFFDLKFPLVWDGEYMSITAADKLIVLERGVIPERTFRIEDIQNEGVNYLAFCNEE
jgi:hypothetical protein